jgi:hypothetical protein
LFDQGPKDLAARRPVGLGQTLLHVRRELRQAAQHGFPLLFFQLLVLSGRGVGLELGQPLPGRAHPRRELALG